MNGSIIKPKEGFLQLFFLNDVKSNLNDLFIGFAADSLSEMEYRRENELIMLALD